MTARRVPRAQRRDLAALLVCLCLGVSACLMPASRATENFTPSQLAASATPATATSPAAPSSPSPPLPVEGSGEILITPIALAGPLAAVNSEISGMAWYSDTLLLLPQYPGRFQAEGQAGALFSLSRADLLAAVAGAPGPLTPQAQPFNDQGLEDRIPGFEGYEAVAISGDRIFLLMEARQAGRICGYLIGGRLLENGRRIQLDPQAIVELIPPVQIENTGFEALLAAGSMLVVFFEANGQNLTPNPSALLFDHNLTPRGSLSMPAIEYRLTDATPADEFGVFWVINYLFPGDAAKLDPAPDALIPPAELGRSHRASAVVERLIPLQFSESGLILPEDEAPLQLELSPSGQGRNWEAIAWLDDRGFLIAADRYPDTIFAFIPLP
jgi:hypothetical protein